MNTRHGPFFLFSFYNSPLIFYFRFHTMSPYRLDYGGEGIRISRYFRDGWEKLWLGEWRKEKSRAVGLQTERVSGIGSTGFPMSSWRPEIIWAIR